MHHRKDIAVIVLAAGNASRMGYAKQLLHFKGKSLIRNAVEVAQKVAGSASYVVLGAYLQNIQEELTTMACQVVTNKDWNNGMGSSLKVGLKAVLAKYPAMETVIIMVADQPFVNEDLLVQMKNEQIASNKNIIACKYREEWGTPVLFMQPFFEQLLDLPDDTGAKKLVMQNLPDVAFVDFPQGSIDVDTEEDYKNLNKLY